ncbi:hypothetical protein BH11BAC2_BH11BAC2_17030 [soil metagenome]
MNSQHLIIAFAIVTPLSSMKNHGNLSMHSKSNQILLADRTWKIKNITTYPAILDINGDGQLEAELYNSLQEAERNKKIIFSSEGKVWEYKTVKSIHSVSVIRQQNGTWRTDSGKDMISWIQEDGTIFTMQISEEGINKILLSYGTEDLQVDLILEEV